MNWRVTTWSNALLVVVFVVGQVVPATARATQGDARGGRTVPSVLRFQRASVWSLQITSQRLLADTDTPSSMRSNSLTKKNCACPPSRTRRS